MSRVFDKSRPRPPWVTDTTKCRRAAYWAQLWQAQPAWADADAIRRVYREAKRWPGLTVDHIVPLNSPHVCGLHVAHNLQLISAQTNTRKGNRWWPDSWDGVPGELPIEHEPHQMALLP